MLVDKRNASRITSSRSLKGATFLLAGWRLSHPKELPWDLPVLLECHSLTMNTIVLQLSDAVADISMLQCSALFRILIINAHFVVDNATHALASSAIAKPTFNVEEEVVVIRNGWTPKKRRRSSTHDYIPMNTACHNQHWPPQPQQNPLSTLKRKTSSSVMDGLQKKKKKMYILNEHIIGDYSTSLWYNLQCIVIGY